MSRCGGGWPVADDGAGVRHRYLPAGRGNYGHPVLSIYQTDIIVYGTDLADYIDNEFGGSGWASARSGGRGDGGLLDEFL